jgi:hypothetical protein
VTSAPPHGGGADVTDQALWPSYSGLPSTGLVTSIVPGSGVSLPSLMTSM